jgi:hypothetical protein
MSSDCSVTLHSSWKGVASSFIGSFIVFAAGAAAAAVGGSTGSWIFFSVGIGLVVGVFLDYPVAARFDRDGVTRRALLRRHRIEWERVGQLTRARPGIAAAARNLNPGGLTAKVGRRRYLLVDQCESRPEFEALMRVFAGRDDLGLDDLIVPPDGVDPTWTYRRARWTPQAD